MNGGGGRLVVKNRIVRIYRLLQMKKIFKTRKVSLFLLVIVGAQLHYRLFPRFSIMHYCRYGACVLPNDLNDRLDVASIGIQSETSNFTMQNPLPGTTV